MVERQPVVVLPVEGMIPGQLLEMGAYIPVPERRKIAFKRVGRIVGVSVGAQVTVGETELDADPVGGAGLIIPPEAQISQLLVIVDLFEAD